MGVGFYLGMSLGSEKRGICKQAFGGLGSFERVRVYKSCKTDK